MLIEFPYKCYSAQESTMLTSGFKLVTRSVHRSFVPVTPWGKTPPKAAAIAATLLI